MRKKDNIALRFETRIFVFNERKRQGGIQHVRENGGVKIL